MEHRLSDDDRDEDANNHDECQPGVNGTLVYKVEEDQGGYASDGSEDLSCSRLLKSGVSGMKTTT